MGEKDTIEKTLKSYNDVFVDIVNVLLFNGKQVISENGLIDDVTHSYYKANNKHHSQERDVSKFWNNNNIRIALYGMENQTTIDKNMPLRVIGYAGVLYRSQILRKNQNKAKYPVITLVLYFGKNIGPIPSAYLIAFLFCPNSNHL